MTDQPQKPYVTTDNQLDALALIEAVAANDKHAEAAIVATYTDNPAGLITGLTVITMTLANLGATLGAWPSATDALQLARLGVLDATNTEENTNNE